MSETSEISNGLTKIFSKTHGQKKKNSASNSIQGDSDSHHSIRASLEDALEKIKSGTDEDGDHSGLKKLIPNLGSKKRRKKQEEEQQHAEDVARGRSVAERGTLDNDDNKSFVSKSGGSSLLTYESDTESAPSPPTLSSHPSHIGYLTTSSPLVQSTTLPEPTLVEPQLDGTPRSSTFPLQAGALASESTPDLSLRTPEDGSHKRSPSPVGRLRQALRPRRSTSPTSSPDRQTAGTAGLLGKDKFVTQDRRGSVASRIGSIFPDKPSPSASHSTTSSPERPRTAKITIDTKAEPRTPPSVDNAPLIVNTPPTPTDTTSPQLLSTRERGTSDPVPSNPNVVTSPSGNMISHRRVKSGSITLGPSKLSNITSAPLTPTPELSSSPGQSGFFSSVFSAAQNAANSLSNSISNTSVAPSGQRSKSSTQEIKIMESPEVETLGEKADFVDTMDEKEPAVKTLGLGDLSLSHLGISETSSGANTPALSKSTEESRGRSEMTSEDSLAAGDNVEITPITHVEDVQSLVRPRSVYEPSAGERTPPNGSVFEGKSGIQRSGSIRSAMGHRRKRGSSAATGTTIGAAIAATNLSLANPNGPGSKLTGFAVASKKRNRDFHQLFRSVPDDDYLIEDYSCALQREILAHGRLYVSEGHLCFSSNIFGWVTTLVMSFDEIVSVEKRSTALLFKNGLMISTLHAKNIFASFTSRDSTYDLIVGIWKLGHPSLRSSLNGVVINETGGDKTEKADAGVLAEHHSGSESGDGSEEGDDVYDEDDDDDDRMSYSQAEGSLAGSDGGENTVSRKASAAAVSNGAPEKSKEDGAPPLGDFPGPATHTPTDCTDQDTHYSKILADEIIPAPLGKIYSLMFGSQSISWMKNWLSGEQKCLEFTMDDKRPLGLDNRIRTYSYIKPLNGAIGPKQTKCLCTENLDFLDLEKAISVTISTQNPDVPSGNVFSVKTKYCLTWAEGPIEKGANDGQNQYAKDLIAALKATVSSRRSTLIVVGGKGKKKGRKGRESSKGLSKTADGASDSKPLAEDWGLLEPLRGPIGPIVDILRPLLTGNVLYGIMVGLLVASWFRFGFLGTRSGGNKDFAMGFLGTPERIIAYEEMWKREESELWDWLEERVGTERLRDEKSTRNGKHMDDKLRAERMEQREVEAAIRVTEEKLNVLKGAVGKKAIKVQMDIDPRPQAQALNPSRLETKRAGAVVVQPDNEVEFVVSVPRRRKKKRKRDRDKEKNRATDNKSKEREKGTPEPAKSRRGSTGMVGQLEACHLGTQGQARTGSLPSSPRIGSGIQTPLRGMDTVGEEHGGRVRFPAFDSSMPPPPPSGPPASTTAHPPSTAPDLVNWASSHNPLSNAIVACNAHANQKRKHSSFHTPVLAPAPNPSLSNNNNNNNNAFSSPSPSYLALLQHPNPDFSTFGSPAPTPLNSGMPSWSAGWSWGGLADEMGMGMGMGDGNWDDFQFGGGGSIAEQQQQQGVQIGMEIQPTGSSIRENQENREQGKAHHQGRGLPVLFANPFLSHTQQTQVQNTSLQRDRDANTVSFPSISPKNISQLSRPRLAPVSTDPRTLSPAPVLPASGPDPRVGNMPNHNPNDIRRKPSLYAIPVWKPPEGSVNRGEEVNSNAPLQSLKHTSSAASPLQQHTISDSPPPSKRPKHSPNLIIDIAQTCQEVFPFALLAERHNKPIQKIFDTFSAIIQLPLLRQAADNRRHGQLGTERMRGFREAKKSLEKARKKDEGLKDRGGWKKKGKKKDELLKMAILNSAKGAAGSDASTGGGGNSETRRI
ncbi:hypothetical protein B7494_g5310 [Chlorociboria aeruginascens]|nr:hypothetical protein B7494_g5310 [Chlorociboria aeruginascens]